MYGSLTEVRSAAFPALQLARVRTRRVRQQGYAMSIIAIIKKVMRAPGYNNYFPSRHPPRIVGKLSCTFYA